MNPKEFYRNYLADDEIHELNYRLIGEVMKFDPASVLEFGMGSGKNLSLLNRVKCNYSGSDVVTCGVDISPIAVMKARLHHGLDFVALADETHLRYFANFDCVFTCSVLDHVLEKDFAPLVNQLKRIANKAVIIAETNDVPGIFYYPHDYEKEGFVRLDYSWASTGDGATYHIWIWVKSAAIKSNDDLA